MGLEDIDIKSVEVIKNPDGSQTAKIAYVDRPRPEASANVPKQKEPKTPIEEKDPATPGLLQTAWSHNTVKALTLGASVAVAINVLSFIVRL